MPTCPTPCSALCFSSFSWTFHTTCSSGVCWPPASCQLAVQRSGGDQMCFPIHSHSSPAGIASRTPSIPWSTPACVHVTAGWGLSCPAWLSSAAQVRLSCRLLPLLDDCKGVTVSLPHCGCPRSHLLALLSPVQAIMSWLSTVTQTRQEFSHK